MKSVFPIGVIIFAQNSDQRSTQVIQVDRPGIEGELNLTFGSCFGSNGAETNIFENIAGSDVFMWLGDSAYFGPNGPLEDQTPATVEEIEREFSHTKNNIGYQKML